MRNRLLMVICSSLLLASGCATNHYDRDGSSPKIDRISAEELARLIPPPVATLSLADLVK